MAYVTPADNKCGDTAYQDVKKLHVKDLGGEPCNKE